MTPGWPDLRVRCEGCAPPLLKETAPRVKSAWHKGFSGRGRQGWAPFLAQNWGGL